jgi:hypothetical protein
VLYKQKLIIIIIICVCLTGDADCVVYDPRCPHPRVEQAGVMVGDGEIVIFGGCLE